MLILCDLGQHAFYYFLHPLFNMHTCKILYTKNFIVVFMVFNMYINLQGIGIYVQ